MIFGDNLRQLSRTYPSISELSRQLGINRTQFNRYLSGESFPRPDVLDRICSFFGTDARILLHPVAAISQPAPLPGSDFLQDYLTPKPGALREGALPSGLYQVTCRTGGEPDGYISTLILIFRHADGVFVRGHAARGAHRPRHEFRGYATCQKGGLMLVTSQRGAQNAAATFLTRLAQIEMPVWTGHVLHHPDAAICQRAFPVIYEHLGRDRARIKRAARRVGALTGDQLSTLEITHLRADYALT
ncbi:helix-turn-helix domain-containing protein [Ruegeria sp. 2012CJ41-6]|uniref:Helix-turn-helix domain-containing protein n=1 Tax=Ruegeria spongiae TaxID=2942209 RepID=A0ABT0PZK1_9RHOB|nr:helix-turn-helix transcriptional regulator [Ruegeria spongiae]MCL6283051.1 helix-turn-helix domain-containing protein [Ruegeria spongiae]